MPKYNVMVNLTRTIEYSVEIENVSAKDEESAQQKVEDRISKIQEDHSKDVVKALDFEQTSEDDSFDYEVSEV